MIAVTGAAGFVARFVCTKASATGLSVRALMRSRDGAMRRAPPFPQEAEVIQIGEIEGRIVEERALEGMKCIIHCAPQSGVSARASHEDIA